jgi:hypothetical protein
MEPLCQTCLGISLFFEVSFKHLLKTFTKHLKSPALETRLPDSYQLACSRRSCPSGTNLKQSLAA